MTQYRDQAIADLSAAVKHAEEPLRLFLERKASLNGVYSYAVAHREMEFELEAKLATALEKIRINDICNKDGQVWHEMFCRDAGIPKCDIHDAWCQVHVYAWLIQRLKAEAPEAMVRDCRKPCEKCGGRDVISKGPTGFTCQHCWDQEEIERLEKELGYVNRESNGPPGSGAAPDARSAHRDHEVSNSRPAQAVQPEAMGPVV